MTLSIGRFMYFVSFYGIWFWLQPPIFNCVDGQDSFECSEAEICKFNYEYTLESS